MQNRKPLIIRGARQTGKSRLIEEFGKGNYKHLIVVNFEKEPHLKSLFEKEPRDIIRELEIIKETPIIEGQTLLFIDEIQECPAAITKLRYFYEDTPKQHVIAAGSLLEFVLEREALSFPVGRVDFHYLFPLTFDEFLNGSGKTKLFDAILNSGIKENISNEIHNQARKVLREYLIVGGMPEAVARYLETGSYREAEFVKESILETYQDDFKKYSKKVNIDNLETVYREAPRLIGQRINLSKMFGEIRARDTGTALKLLQKAMIVYRVERVHAASFPLVAFRKTQPKLLFLDLGLVQHANHISAEILETENYSSIYKGGFAEQFVGQELMSLLSGHTKPELFYWQRENKGATAEIDYLFPGESQLFPIEVKAGSRGGLFSLHQFMAKNGAKVAVRIYDGELRIDEISVVLPEVKYRLLSLPLYMVSSLPRLIQQIHLITTFE